MTSVAILGCGYVGLELGNRLLDSEDTNRVIGVRRSDSGVNRMESAGIEPVQGNLSDEETLSSLPSVDVVVFAASSGGGDASTARRLYVDCQRSVVDHFGNRDDPPDRYVYTSSTGVYGDHDGDWVDEDTPLEPTTDRERLLAAAETVALDRTEEHGIDGTVTRFAGLYGPGRYRLERYLQGPVTEGILNLTHRSDAAGAIEFLLETGQARDEIVLVVDDEPVSKWDLADWLASQCECPEPPKQTKTDRLADESLSSAGRRRIRTQKRCRNEKLRSLGYDLQYPTYREGYRRAIEEYQE